MQFAERNPAIKVEARQCLLSRPISSLQKKSSPICSDELPTKVNKYVTGAVLVDGALYYVACYFSAEDIAEVSRKNLHLLHDAAVYRIGS